MPDHSSFYWQTPKLAYSLFSCCFWHLAKYKQRTMWSRLISDPLEQSVLNLNQTTIAGTTLSTREREDHGWSPQDRHIAALAYAYRHSPHCSAVQAHASSKTPFNSCSFLQHLLQYRLNAWFNDITSSSVLSFHHHFRGFRLNTSQIMSIFIYSILIINKLHHLVNNKKNASNVHQY